MTVDYRRVGMMLALTVIVAIHNLGLPDNIITVLWLYWNALYLPHQNLELIYSNIAIVVAV